MTLFDGLKQALLEQIRQSPPNTKLPSERELVEAHGVSRSTVNKVIVELERERYVVRRRGSGTYVLPRDSRIEFAGGAAEEVGRVAGEIIIAYPNFFSSVLWDAVDEAEQLAVRNNFKLTNLKLQPQTDYSSLFSLMNRSTELVGVILIPPGESSFSRTVMEKLSKYGCPVTLLDSSYPQGQGVPNIYQVCRNEFQTGYLMMDELLRNGHRKIGYIPNEPVTPCSQEVYRGMKQALYDRKLRWKDLAKPEERNLSWHSSIDAGFELTLPVLEAHPELTALVYDTVPGAFAGLAALAKLGKRCPDDISIIAGTDMFGCERFTVPALSSVSISSRELTKVAVDIILHPRKRWNSNILIDVQLTRRDSIRAIPQ